MKQLMSYLVDIVNDYDNGFIPQSTMNDKILEVLTDYYKETTGLQQVPADFVISTCITLGCKMMELYNERETNKSNETNG